MPPCRAARAMADSERVLHADTPGAAAEQGVRWLELFYQAGRNVERRLSVYIALSA